MHIFLGVKHNIFFTGWNKCQSTMVEGVIFSQNVYNAPAWSIVPHAVITDQVPTTFTRAPGSLQVNLYNTVEHVQHSRACTTHVVMYNAVKMNNAVRM